jgi:DNA-binding NtrC family response regulator/tetratricopeptide (TPR) repeat protein
MHTFQGTDIHAASQLIRRGRYSEAVTALQGAPKPRGRDALTDALLADVLQRVGQNLPAEEIALRQLRRLSQSSPLYARYHFVLGSVERDRGNTASAIKHLQIAAGFSDDLELACWSQLRLIGAIAEVSGVRTAIARLDEIKRILTRFGDARPFAALHLWLVEAESTRGNLKGAWSNLRTAETLLSQVDDVWLRGYLAVNRSALHYYSGEIREAREWAEKAIVHSNESGHRTTRRAANVNLGNIQFSQGQLSEAETCFQTALDCSERASVSEVIILENIAQIKLQLEDFKACKNVLFKLEQLTDSCQDAKRTHYNRWALQTKIRLLLKEGKSTEARQISKELERLARDAPNARVSAASHLLNAETFLAARDPSMAAHSLESAISPAVQLPPDLYAEMERVAGGALAMSGASELAEVHLERAYRTFDLIGHSLGKERVTREGRLSSNPASPGNGVGATWCLDRIRVLLDVRNRPELFGHEAMLLLQDLKCAHSMALMKQEGDRWTVIRQQTSRTAHPTTNEITIVFDSSGHPIKLCFIPLDDTSSTLSTLTFQRVLRNILDISSPESLAGDQEIVWGTNENASATGGVFVSDPMLAVLRVVKKVAPTDVSVLVTGETGTGKEVIAKTIHEYSRRSALPFLALNCAAVPKDLLESQLFGHRKGAFSGAAENHQGIVRAANGGTLFLDEIGETPMDMQAKLLRFLEMGEIHPVGESHPVKVNVRLIFATNDDLEAAVSQNRFRQDLFYRLNVIPIKVPPLRERREEIPILANLFAQRFAAEFTKDAVRFSSKAMELLIFYSWPGNIRQLANEVRRVTALAESGSDVGPEHLSPPLQGQILGSRARDSCSASVTSVRIDQPLEQAMTDLESEMIKRALRQAGGRMSVAASALGISRKGLYLKRLRLGLTDFNEKAH